MPRYYGIANGVLYHYFIINSNIIFKIKATICRCHKLFGSRLIRF